jgi:hypothetical protein
MPHLGIYSKKELTKTAAIDPSFISFTGTDASSRLK